MNITILYFSPTGNTQKVCKTIASSLSSSYKEIDITLSKNRVAHPQFEENEVVIVGFPVYAGRIPNLLLPYLSNLKSKGNCCIPVVTFGNRAFDDALLELSDILFHNGFRIIAAGSFVGQHSFSDTLGAGRPNEKDWQEIESFALKIKEALKDGGGLRDYSSKIPGERRERRVYFQPKAPTSGEPINILKVKPITTGGCADCGVCATVCPMGAISLINYKEIIGKCIKCNACVKSCSLRAKTFIDAGYIIHKEDLEKSEAAAKENFTITGC